MLAAALVAGASSAEDERAVLLNASLEAEVREGEPTAVVVNYFFRTEGSVELRFTSIQFGESRAANIRAFLGESEVSFETPGEVSGKVEGAVALPAYLASAERVHLRLRYEVHPETETDPTELMIPVLVALAPPRRSAGGTFRATVRLPDGLEVHDAFPSDLSRVSTSDPAVGSSVETRLPAMPSLLRLRVGREPLGVWNPILAVDIGAAIVLLAAGLLGWRRLRELQRLREVQT